MTPDRPQPALGASINARSVRAKAPAKINLTLEVLGRRSDGFHALRSLVIGVGLYDEVRCALAPRDSFTLACSESALATPKNLAVRAADLLAQTVAAGGGLAIELTKRIPVGGGLGGGSSDAAAVLRAYNGLLGEPLPDAALARLGAKIGSDVAVFFGLPTAIMTGRGERVQPRRLEWGGFVLLILPGIMISTRDVYAAWTPQDAGRRHGDRPHALLEAASAAQITEGLTNDLEPAVFRVSPDLAELVCDLRRVGYEDIRVSGSGATLFGLFDDLGEADHAAAAIAARFPYLTTTVVPAPVGMDSVRSEDK